MWNCTENQIEFVFIRHGKTKANQEKRYLGKTEEPLSELGREELLGKRYPKVQSLFISPMVRCRQTAELLYPGLSYQCISEWEEMDFGRFEGKNYEDLKDNLDYQRWIDSGGTLPFPKGESREEFILRCGRGLEYVLEQLLKQETLKNPPVGAIVHGGTIMALLSRYGSCRDYFDYQCKNGEGYRCQVRFRKEDAGRLEKESIRITEIEKVAVERGKA